MASLVVDDGTKESDYGYVLRVSGPRECSLTVACLVAQTLLRAGNHAN